MVNMAHLVSSVQMLQAVQMLFAFLLNLAQVFARSSHARLYATTLLLVSFTLVQSLSRSSTRASCDARHFFFVLSPKQEAIPRLNFGQLGLSNSLRASNLCRSRCCCRRCRRCCGRCRLQFI
eukprot:gnl/TRDRNA2_/TRDRNA2_172801_c1_seq2.p1 gnl/TRDRNA2_/TRDRNA2_172801_c1~~gnl/TRDRNA2_/TRDRNA2_172801_c1_seq2.p1  ORF type:complete len:122 (+),score=10.33 gnl/TRDRNA2_/TRDRNA2_172801_c1_seq2:144-509(+)